MGECLSMDIWIEIFCIEAIWIYLYPTHNQQHIFHFMVKSWHKHTLAHRFTYVCVCVCVCVCVYLCVLSSIHTHTHQSFTVSQYIWHIFHLYISSVYDSRLVVDIPIISRWGILNASRTRKCPKDSCDCLTSTPKVQICRGYGSIRLLSIF